MRARNREVNIFNMSLLDILTGMLGAFLFLMLGLVPYYTKVKDLQQNPQDSSANSDKPYRLTNVLTVIARWNPKARANIFLYDPNNAWTGAGAKQSPFPHGVKVIPDACYSSAGWQSTTILAFGNVRYLMVYALPPGSNPALLDRISFSVDLTTQKIDNTGKNDDGDAPAIVLSSLTPAQARVGPAYAAFWIHVTEDDTQKEYYNQYNVQIEPLDATDKLPPGVVPSPTPWQSNTLPF
jgi:hypothetical protein